MKKKFESIICDVCMHEYFNEDSVTEIEFSYNKVSYKFDCCYNCLRGNSIRGMYKKITKIIKGEL
jgi:hypothetical protein